MTSVAAQEMQLFVFSSWDVAHYRGQRLCLQRYKAHPRSYTEQMMHLFNVCLTSFAIVWDIAYTSSW